MQMHRYIRATCTVYSGTSTGSMDSRPALPRSTQKSELSSHRFGKHGIPIQSCVDDRWQRRSGRHAPATRTEFWTELSPCSNPALLQRVRSTVLSALAHSTQALALLSRRGCWGALRGSPPKPRAPRGGPAENRAAFLRTTLVNE